jgi:hypothetical protein
MGELDMRDDDIYRRSLADPEDFWGAAVNAIE